MQLRASYKADVRCVISLVSSKISSSSLEVLSSVLTIEMFQIIYKCTYCLCLMLVFIIAQKDCITETSEWNYFYKSNLDRI